MSIAKIGFGGGCHWCTEAVFQSLRGVQTVDQGFIKSHAPHDGFSEAVIVTFDPDAIPLHVLVDVHLRTHASTSSHKLRGKYRSAVYTYDTNQGDAVREILTNLQPDFDARLVTTILPFVGFKPSIDQFQNYYLTNTSKPFCKTYIDPKLATIRQQFGTYFAAQGHAEP